MPDSANRGFATMEPDNQRDIKSQSSASGDNLMNKQPSIGEGSKKGLKTPATDSKLREGTSSYGGEGGS